MEPRNIEAGSSHYAARYDHERRRGSILLAIVIIAASMTGVTLAIALPIVHAHASQPVP